MPSSFTNLFDKHQLFEHVYGQFETPEFLSEAQTLSCRTDPAPVLMWSMNFLDVKMSQLCYTRHERRRIKNPQDACTGNIPLLLFMSLGRPSSRTANAQLSFSVTYTVFIMINLLCFVCNNRQHRLVIQFRGDEEFFHECRLRQSIVGVGVEGDTT